MRKMIKLAFLLLAATIASAEERWYVFSIGGTPVGYVSEISNAGTTETVLFARLTRLGKSIEMRFTTTTTEDADGNLQSLAFESMLSKQVVRLEARVDATGVRVRSGDQERTVDRADARILGPIAIARLTAEKLRAPGDAVEYAIFSPELQRVTRARRVVAGNEPIACGNGTALKITETIEGWPAARTLWIDRGATMVADTIPGPFGAMSTCRETREAALAANGTLPADLYERTLARSNIRLADPAAVDRIVLRVRARDASIALPDFTFHNQRVLSTDVVEIRRPSGGQAILPLPNAEEYLEPNAFIESTHPDIVAIAKRFDEKDPFALALALTKWTAETMTMDAGIVMAPASELIRDRRATCMGYATLLASLARAAKIPSRIVMGYVYYGGIWGGHAWTEMWIGDRWLPFDAAVYAPGIASATRLAAGASSFRDGGGDLNAALGRLFGRVDVETIEVEQYGRVIRAGAAPFRIERGTYSNPGLGIRIDANGYAIERADSTWPSTLVVAFRRGETTIELHQKMAFPSRGIEPRDGTAVFAVPEGATLWVWSAQGPNAEEALRRFLTRVEKKRSSAS